MKKIFKPLIFACTVALLSISCDSDENSHSYTGTDQAYYDVTNYSINATDNEDNTASLIVITTTSSSTDRQLSLSVDPSSTATLGVDFNLPLSVTIPANSYKGTVELTSLFTQNTLEGVEAVINITDPIAAQFKNQAFVSIEHRSCDAITGMFIGDYSIEQIEGDNGFGESFTTAFPVTLADAGENLRSFEVGYLIDAPLPLVLNFDCSYITITNTIAPVTCEGEIIISNAPQGLEGTYFPSNDDVFYFTFTETIPEACPVANSSVIMYKFTKL